MWIFECEYKNGVSKVIQIIKLVEITEKKFSYIKRQRQKDAKV